MIKAELKRLHSPDIFDLETYKPEIADEFGFFLQILIGEKNQKGEESFDLFVCTPKWLLNNCKESDIIFGYHYMIVFKYDFSVLKEKIESYVNNLSGLTWDEIANKMSLVGKWEFENYKSY